MKKPEPIVFVIDDDDAVRRTVELTLRAHQIRTRGFPSAEDFLTSVTRIPPGCLIVDLRLPGLSGLDLITLLTQREGTLATIILTGQPDIAYEVQSTRVRVLDVLNKPVNAEDLVRSVRRAIQADAETRANPPGMDLFRKLSPRERQVLHLVASGKSTRWIAAVLGISPKTVQVHGLNLKRKVGATSVGALVRLSEATVDPYSPN